MKIKHLYAHMAAAAAYAACSTATRLQVGALYVKFGRPIGEGYNGMPPGGSNDCEYEGINGLTTKDEVRHAEQNALLSIAGSNESVRGADLFVTHSPCPMCADDQATAGVRRVFFREPYRVEAGIKALLRRGVEVYRLLDGGRINQYHLVQGVGLSSVISEPVFDREDWS